MSLFLVVLAKSIYDLSLTSGQLGGFVVTLVLFPVVPALARSTGAGSVRPVAAAGVVAGAGTAAGASAGPRDLVWILPFPNFLGPLPKNGLELTARFR